MHTILHTIRGISRFFGQIVYAGVMRRVAAPTLLESAAFVRRKLRRGRQRHAPVACKRACIIAPVLCGAGTPSFHFGSRTRERSAEKRGGLRDLLGGWRSRPTRLRGVSASPCDRRSGASRRSTGGDFKSPGPRFLGRGEPCQSQSSEAPRGAVVMPHERGPEASRVRGTNPPAGAASCSIIETSPVTPSTSRITGLYS